jgi:hypothetical protein
MAISGYPYQQVSTRITVDDLADKHTDISNQINALQTSYMQAKEKAAAEVFTNVFQTSDHLKWAEISDPDIWSLPLPGGPPKPDFDPEFDLALLLQE